MKSPRWLGIFLLVVFAGLVDFMWFWLRDPAGDDWVLPSLGLPMLYVILGLVVMAKRPGHVVGWLLMIIGCGLAFTNISTVRDDLDARWYPWIAWAFFGVGGYLTYAAIVILLLVFPDGLGDRSPLGRRMARVAIGFMVGLVVLAAASDTVAGAEGSGLGVYPNPLGIRLVPREVVEYGYLLLFAVILGSVIWMWHRQRRQQGEARRRYTLVLYSFAVLIISLIVGALFNGLLGDTAWLPAYLTWFGLPVAFAIAVIRHGLYGVDRIVSRTVSYGLLGAALSVVYVVPVLTAPRLLDVSNDLVVAGSTLAAAALFNPLRRRIQHSVDRRFNRARFDAQNELEAFSAILTSQLGVDDVTRAFVSTTQRVLQPSSVHLWMKG